MDPPRLDPYEMEGRADVFVRLCGVDQKPLEERLDCIHAEFFITCTGESVLEGQLPRDGEHPVHRDRMKGIGSIFGGEEPDVHRGWVVF